MSGEYEALNPIFSKLEHSTSWSIRKQVALDRGGIRSFMVIIGLTACSRLSAAIRDHIKSHGLEPNSEVS
jgi:hypothetical protein